MKKLLSLLSVFALAAIAAGTASAGSIATPTGLNPGDQFRIVFLTSSQTIAKTSDLSTYDNFVSSNATGYTYGGNSPTWQAIVSSPTIDARDHIGLLSTSVIPLYTVDGTKVSTGNLWSGTLLSPINRYIDGSTHNYGAYTGTKADGTKSNPVGPVGTDWTNIGLSNATNSQWIAWTQADPVSLRNLYGISDVLTVPAAVPEPSTVMLVGLGGLAALGYSFKRKRN